MSYLPSVLARISLVALLAAVSGCTNEDYDGRVANRGTLCVRPADAEASPATCPLYEFEADGTLVLGVDFGICLSSTCDENLQASCSATVEGSVVTVKAQGSYSHRGDECSEDCMTLNARCEVGPLPAGDYELTYAGKTLALTLPSARANVCTGSGFGCCDGDADCAEGTCGEQNGCVVPE